ncbi:hypothetical protein BJL90_10310 [Clostridium formicaceticum]|nr:hypothetical protein BJL90_10310 [Clostridium formicaceticum]
MGQLLLNRQAEFNLGLCPVGGIDFDRISDFFELDENHRFIHCMLVGVPANYTDTHNKIKLDNGIMNYLQKADKSITKHIDNYSNDKTFASFIDFDWKKSMKNMKHLSKEEHEDFHAKQPNIRRFSKRALAIPLNNHNFQESDYLLRSTKRDFINKTIPFEKFSKFLALLKQTNIEGKPFYLYTSASETYGVKAYLYIKENSVEGLAEGIYCYHPVEHELVLVTSELSKSIKPSYTPFNRKYFQKAGFCLFLVGQMNTMKPIYKDESLFYALLESGYIGQLVMDKQAEFDIGVCPIGGLDFDRIRSDFKLGNEEVLLHSFLCGSFEQELPEDREFLEVGRGKKDKKESEEKFRKPVPLKKKRSALQHDIAIVGISGRYPGAENLEEYWENIQDGKNSISELSDSRKKLWMRNWPDVISRQTSSVRGGFLDDIDCFDSLLFNIAPSEARTMDPQERLFAEVVWECLENSGYTAKNLIHSSGKIGVFVGAMWSDYQNQSSYSYDGIQITQATALHSSIANRISYFFNFSGPSIAFNTSCSSAMTAIHFACESIKRGECDAALVGGVNLFTHPYHQDLLTSLDLLSKDGVCRPLAAQATGWLGGEGVGAILIKSVEDAERDKDYIHGIIKGTAIGHSGRTTRFGAPSSTMQAESIKMALENAGVSAESINYIELAAAGASIADASEIDAIRKVFKDYYDTLSPCFIGSVKANIGHLESASAMSQIAKVLLQMKHRQLAPTINFKPINPLVKLQEFEIIDRLKPWTNQSKKNGIAEDKMYKPLRALINAFGATGTSGHVIIEEYLREKNKQKDNSKLTLIPISAATKEQLNQQVLRLHDFLTGNEVVSVNIADIGYTLQQGRVEMDERLAVVVDNIQSLIEKLEMFLRDNEKITGLYRGSVFSGDALKVKVDRNDLFIIAEQWIQGASIDWDILNDGNQRRIPLPNYPFAKEKHWVTEYLGDFREKAVSTNEKVFKNMSLTTPNVDLKDDTLSDNILLTKIENYLKTTFSEVSGIPVSRINAKAALEKYGINSLMINLLNTNLEKNFGDLPKTLFFEYQTIYELAKYFLQNHEEKSKTVLDHSEALVNIPLNDGFEMMVTPKLEKTHSCSYNFKQVASREFDIAIIGLSGKYPKAKTLEEYWENLKNGINCVTEIPVERWDHQKYYDPNKHTPGKTYCKWGGFIDDVDKFDPLFFNISPREAITIDPQERLFLETAWHVFEDAGYTRDSLKETFDGKVGVFVGVMNGEYQLLGTDKVSIASSYYGLIANRVSYLFDFHGPSMAVDTLCSSSLTAIHLAAESIKRGECEAAIAGGVNISLSPNKYIIQARLSMSSTDGRCRSFGEGGDGFVPGEGIGAILLKPLQRAVEDGDHIYGVIKGTSINHGGKTNGYMVPNPIEQCNLVLDAWRKAEIDPRTISYLEAHGTGTALGDPIETAGLTRAFEKDTKDRQFCAIGSVKSNIGHCESAAGIAGVTKILLQLKHRQLVPSLHSEVLNPNIDFSNTPFVVQQELGEWKRPVIEENGKIKEYPRIAGISSFGAGGSNAHVVIQEYIPENLERHLITITPQNPAFIVLSAKNEDRLQEQAQQLLAAIQEQQFTDGDLADMAYTLQIGREAMEERLAILASSIKELEEKLKSFVEGQEGIEDLYRGHVKRNKETLAVFAEDEDMIKIIDVWITKGKYAKLLDLWAKGLIIDWNKLYSDSKLRRISLPTYPFAKERHWLFDVETNEDSIASSAMASAVYEDHSEQRIMCFLQKQWELCFATSTKILNRTVAILTTQETMELAIQLSKYFPNNQILNIHDLELQPRQLEHNWKNYDGCVDLIGCGKEKNELLNWIGWLKQLIEYGHREDLMMLCVSKGLESYQNTTVNLSGASRVGLYRMLQSEYGHLRSRHMDAEPFTDDKTLAQQIVSEFFMDCEDTEICYRDGKRYRAYLEEFQKCDASDETLVFPDEHVLWITGGTRGIGYLCARHFVTNHGVRRLVLTGRETMPPREQWDFYKPQNTSIAQKIRNIQALEAQGVQVQVLSVSLTDEYAIQQSLQEIKNTMGPIGGIIHCAGISDMKNPAFIRKSVSGIQQVLDPKVAGLDILYQSFKNEALQFFVLFSSVSAIIPSLASGQSDYAMANAYMDYVAEANIHDFPVVSIQWPNWKETGMGEVKTKAYQQTGLLSLMNVEGLQLLDQILFRKIGPVVLPAVVNPNLWNPHQLIQRRIQESFSTNIQTLPPVATELSRTSDSLLIATQMWLIDLFSQELKIDTSKLEIDTAFQDYGMDSILMAQILHSINQLLSYNLDPSILYEHSTIESLATWLTNNYASSLSQTLDTMISEQYSSRTQDTSLHISSISIENGGLKSKSHVYKSSKSSDIAVIGLSCRFPGANNLEEYWHLLSEGRSAIGSVPQERWGYSNNFNAGLINNITQFDPKFFLIPENDAKAMDPQALVLLEESLKLWYHAGYSHQEIKGKPVGVYIGGRSQHRPGESSIQQTQNPIVAVGQNYLAANISQFFDLRGPSIVVDTACSSALVGMNMAIQALKDGEIESAIVGGVSLLNTDEAHRIFQQRKILSQETFFHIFDQRADGVILGEGVGMVLLKTVDQALEDGDHIYAVVKALAVNNDGRTAGPATPNLHAQKEVLQTALARSGKKNEEISYIEVNGSGSEVTDLLELKVIQSIYRSSNTSVLGLGSIKPNIGHPLCAEGIASFIKVVLMLQNKQFVPFLSGEQPMTHYNIESSPFYFCRKLTKWTNTPRIAGINCFADGGTNVHVILEAWEERESSSAIRQPIPPPKLNQYDLRYTEVLNSSPQTSQNNRDVSKSHDNWIQGPSANELQHPSDKVTSMWKQKIVEER